MIYRFITVHKIHNLHSFVHILLQNLIFLYIPIDFSQFCFKIYSGQESSASFSEESCAEGDCEESYQNVWKGGCKYNDYTIMHPLFIILYR